MPRATILTRCHRQRRRRCAFRRPYDHGALIGNGKTPELLAHNRSGAQSSSALEGCRRRRRRRRRHRQPVRGPDNLDLAAAVCMWMASRGVRFSFSVSLSLARFFPRPNLPSLSCHSSRCRRRRSLRLTGRSLARTNNGNRWPLGGSDRSVPLRRLVSHSEMSELE